MNLGRDMFLVWESINAWEKLKFNFDLFVPGSRKPILMTLPPLGDLPLASSPNQAVFLYLQTEESCLCGARTSEGAWESVAWKTSTSRGG